MEINTGSFDQPASPPAEVETDTKQQTRTYVEYQRIVWHLDHQSEPPATRTATPEEEAHRHKFADEHCGL